MIFELCLEGEIIPICGLGLIALFWTKYQVYKTFLVPWGGVKATCIWLKQDEEIVAKAINLMSLKDEKKDEQMPPPATNVSRSF